ncbi:MAG: hypothetical protein HKK66_03365 [Chlorobiaceae bacterium]|nr:hypothetical protein [Chlorobiaceae bacterium]
MSLISGIAKGGRGGCVMNNAKHDIEMPWKRILDDAITALLAEKWDVRETKGSYRVCVTGKPDSAASLAVIKKRDGSEELCGAIADMIAMVPEAIACVRMLIEQQPKELCIPPRVAVFLNRVENIGGAL